MIHNKKEDKTVEVELEALVELLSPICSAEALLLWLSYEGKKH